MDGSDTVSKSSGSIVGLIDEILERIARSRDITANLRGKLALVSGPIEAKEGSPKEGKPMPSRVTDKLTIITQLMDKHNADLLDLSNSLEIE